MAIAHGTSTRFPSTDTSGFSTTSGETLSGNIAAGTDVKGVVAVVFNAATANPVSTISYGGQTMTLVDSTTDTTEAGFVGIYELLGDVITGTQSFSMTRTATTTQVWVTVTTMNAATGTIIQRENTNKVGTTTSGNPTVTLTTAATTFIVGGVHGGAAAPTSYVAGTDETVQFSADYGTRSARSSRSTTTHASGSPVYNFTYATSDDWCIIAAAYKETTPTWAATQEAYRFYEDGTEAGSTALGTQSTTLTRSVISNSNILLRVRLKETEGAAGAATDDYKLQYRVNGGSWTDTGTGAVTNFASSNLTDGGATTERLTGGTGLVFMAGEISEDGIVDDLNLGTFDRTELLYALTLNSASFANNDSVEFQVLRNNATTGMTYSSTPTLTITKASFALTQAAYGIYAGEGTETGANLYTPLGNQAPSIDLLYASSVNAGIRIRLQETGGSAGASTDDYKLQYKVNAGSWTDTGSGAVTNYSSANLTDAGSITSARLGAGTGSFVNGLVSEDGTADNLQITASNYTELLYSVTLNGASLADGDVVTFQVLKNNATTDMTYTQTPTINISKTSNWCGNGGFETNTTGWQGTAAGWDTMTVATSTAQFRTGAQSLGATFPTSSVGSAAVLFGVTMKPNTTYTLNGWVYVPTATPDIYPIAWGLSTDGPTVTTKNAWTQSSVTYTNGSTEAKVFLGWRNSGAYDNGDIFYVDDVTIIEHKVVTAITDSTVITGTDIGTRMEKSTTDSTQITGTESYAITSSLSSSEGPATLAKYSFNGGTDGVELTPGDTPYLSDTAFNTVSTPDDSVVEYDDDVTLHGAKSLRIVSPSTAASPYVEWNSFGSQSTFYVRGYSRFLAFPPGPSANLQFVRIRNGTSNVLSLRLNHTTGYLQMAYGTGFTTVPATSVAIPTDGSWFRWELKVVPDTTNGSVELRYFVGANLETITPTATVSASNLAIGFTSIDGIWLGQTGGSLEFTNTFTHHHDEYAISNFNWIGPAGGGAELISFTDQTSIMGKSSSDSSVITGTEGAQTTDNATERENFDAGTNGNTVGNTDGILDAGLDTNSTVTYSNEQSVTGTLSMKGVTTSGTGSFYRQITVNASEQALMHFSIYYYIVGSSNPGVVMPFAWARNSGGTNAARLVVTTGGDLRMHDGNAAPTNADTYPAPRDQWMRLDWKLDHTNNVQTLRVYTGQYLHSGDPAEAIFTDEADLLTAEGVVNIRFGNSAAAVTPSYTTYFDGVGWRASDWTGPAIASGNPAIIDVFLDRTDSTEITGTDTSYRFEKTTSDSTEITGDDLGSVAGGSVEITDDDFTEITGTDLGINFAKTTSDSTQITGTDATTAFAKSTTDSTQITGTDATTTFAKSTTDSTVITGTDATTTFAKTATDSTTLTGTDVTTTFAKTTTDSTTLTGTDAATNFAKTATDGTEITGTDATTTFAKTTSDSTQLTGTDVTTQFAKTASDSTVITGTEVGDLGTVYKTSSDGGGAAVSYGQSKVQSADTTSLTLDSTPAADSILLLAIYGWDYSSDDYDIASISGAGATWSVVQRTANATGYVTEIWKGVGATSTGPITISWTDAPADYSWGVQEISGIGSTAGTTGGARVADSAAISGITAPANGVVVWAVGADTSVVGLASQTPESAFTERFNTTSSPDTVFYTADVTEGVDYSMSADISSSANQTYAYAFFPATAGPNISSTETSSLYKEIAATDSTEITGIDTAYRFEKTTSDSTVITGTDATTTFAKTTSDSSVITGTEGNVSFAKSSSDSTEITGTDATIQFAKSTSDSTTITGTDVATNFAKTATDSTQISSTETTSGSITATGSDSTQITGTDATTQFAKSTTDSTVITGTDATTEFAKTATDSTALTGTDATTNFAKTTSDSTTLSSTETTSGSITATGSDATEITISESVFLDTNLPGSDTTQITSDEVGSVEVQGAVTVTDDDTTEITGTDETTQFAKSTSDSTEITGTEGYGVFAKTTSDSTVITGTEEYGTFSKSTSDATEITGTDATTNFAKSASDSTQIIGTDAATNFAKTASDSTQITSTETTSGNIEASGSDSSTITGTDVTTYFAKSTSDATEITGTDVTTTFAKSVTDSTEITGSESSSGYITATASDTTEITTTEIGSVYIEGTVTLTDTDDTEISSTESSSFNFYLDRSDATEISGTESVTFGTITFSTSDSTQITVTESVAFATISVTASDSTEIGSSESSSIYIDLPGAEQCEITSVESYDLVITGVVTSSDDDITEITSTESSLVEPSIQVSDSTEIDVVEAVHVYKQISTTDSTEIDSVETGSIGTISISGSDSTEMDVVETSSFGMEQKSDSDSTELSVTETFDIVVSGQFDITGADSTEIAYAENFVLLVPLTGSDSTEISSTETSDAVATGSADKQGTDSTEIDISESTTLSITVYGTDSTQITSTEAVAFGTVAFSTSDSTQISVTESISFATIEAAGSDSTEISSVENSATTAAFSASDSTEISSSESGSVQLSGLVPVSSSDTTEISITETESLAYFIPGSDSTQITGSESVAFFVTLSNHDAAEITGSESVQFGQVAFTATDQMSLDSSESGYVTIFKSDSDSTQISIVDLAVAGKTTVGEIIVEGSSGPQSKIIVVATDTTPRVRTQHETGRGWSVW